MGHKRIRSENMKIRSSGQFFFTKPILYIQGAKIIASKLGPPTWLIEQRHLETLTILNGIQTGSHNLVHIRKGLNKNVNETVFSWGSNSTNTAFHLSKFLSLCPWFFHYNQQEYFLKMLIDMILFGQIYFKI